MCDPEIVRLLHMAEAAEEAIQFAAGKRREDLVSNRLLLMGLLREIEIVGEAAAQISEARKRDMPGLPWREIVAMRNRLVHAYFDVDLDIVWNVVSRDLPVVAATIRAALKPEK